MLLSLSGVVADGTTPVTATVSAQPINVYQGVDTTVQVTVTGSNGVAINITGWSATMTVKDRVGAITITGAPKYTNTYTATLTSPSTGVMQFSIPGSDLKSLSLLSYFYDVFTTNTGGKRDEVVLTSTMTVNSAIGA